MLDSMRLSFKSLLIACIGGLLTVSTQAATLIKPQPAAQTVNAGSTASFSVTVTNANPLYQWQFKGANIPGETNASLLIENVRMDQAGAYRVVVITPSQTVTSSVVTLNVLQGTIVHFTLATGTVDIELFDHDKPITVQNFLHYYNYGAYSNVFFHRLVPNFILQGGGYSTTNHSNNPLVLTNIVDVNRFASDTGSSWFLQIKNEYSMGPRVRNTYGTVAMARSRGVTNSAYSQWFFNLADNSTNLDNLDGGFTVFGRVIQGTNVLNAFNSFSTNNGIFDLRPHWPTGLTNMPDYWPSVSGGFAEVPVRSGTAYPRNSDLFFAKVVVSGRPVVDRSLPSLTMTSPKPNSHFTNQTFTVSGTASDNTGISYMDFWVDYWTPDRQFLAPMPLSGTTNWSANVTNLTAGVTNLSPGPYLLICRAWDGYGNKREIDVPIYVLARLTIQTEGMGTVSPNLNGKFLDPFSNYTVTAIPARGNLFAGWSGNGVGGTVPKLTFFMGTNQTIKAKFATNYFPGVLATYTGLFQPTNGVAVTNSGSFTITTTGTGGYSGSILLAGNTLRFTDKFDYLGNSSIKVKIPNSTNVISLTLAIDLTNSTGKVTGKVAGRGWTSELVAYRKVARLAGSLTPGKYVVALAADPAATNQPSGDGYAVLTVSTLGSATVSGKLADGTAIAGTTSIAAGGQWPLYISLYKNTGMLLGWLNLTNSSDSVKWLRPASAGGVYPEFSADLITSSTFYSKPLAGTGFQVILDGGSLAQPVPAIVTINSLGQWVVTGDLASQLKLSFSSSTALVSGKYTPTGAAPLAIFGAFTDPTHGAIGFYTNNAGLSGKFSVISN